jgi:hypothetical protein
VETPFKTNRISTTTSITTTTMSTPFRDDPLPSYLENTKSTAYRWQHDLTDSTAHPSVGGDNTTRDITNTRTPHNPLLASN